jgi:HlyD family secretion protein
MAALVWAFLPTPLAVDVAQIRRDSLRVTVDEDGKTRIKDRYVISAPLGGKMERIHLLAGDPVQAGQTILATLQPTAPQFLDAREISQASASVKSAEAAVERAETANETARLNLSNAQSRRDRAKTIASSRAMSTEELEQADTNFYVAEQSQRAATFAVKIAEFELQLALAAVVQTTQDTSSDVARFTIVAPTDGVVLRVVDASSKIVTPGQPLLEIGDPGDLEVVIDVLSKDAVMIRSGDIIEVDGWGGENTLEARVRSVEPSAFTHISALGVEEQRVNIVADFAGDVANRQGLGDNYRIEARIVVWENDDVVTVPTSALFRNKDRWSVFIVRDGLAKQRPIELGKRNARYAEVVNGVAAGDTVIVHPSDQVIDGKAVVIR